mmetsp:Transcript_36759/g.32983  ORF Transcript_36759/g.32983 Transcript_36759/m.32983 type:complete len:206 (-) Transcript_36759:2116-2733(-)
MRMLTIALTSPFPVLPSLFCRSLHHRTVYKVSLPLPIRLAAIQEFWPFTSPSTKRTRAKLAERLIISEEEKSAVTSLCWVSMRSYRSLRRVRNSLLKMTTKPSYPLNSKLRERSSAQCCIHLISARIGLLSPKAISTSLWNPILTSLRDLSKSKLLRRRSPDIKTRSLVSLPLTSTTSTRITSPTIRPLCRASIAPLLTLKDPRT